METNKDLQNKIDSTLGAMDAIKTVEVSPFFKDKTMQLLFAEKEVEQTAWLWFSPRLQLATLICFVVLNVFAFKAYNSNKYDTNISQFAESYGIKSTETISSFLN